MLQSRYVTHLYSTDDLDMFIDENDLSLEYDTRDKIEDLAKFKRELEAGNLMTSELNKFIDDYIKFNND